MPQNYDAPLDEIKFILHQWLKLEKIFELGNKIQDYQLVDVILEQAATFASQELLPLNEIGDRHKNLFTAGKVTTAPGFKEAYQKFAESGWVGLTAPENLGGQNLPFLLNFAATEIFNSANMAFFLCPLLSQGAIELLKNHGSPSQHLNYLPNLVSGKWTGTMCLTEPSAGSDLAAIKTRATKNNEHYLIKGQKIYITYGEHDLAENIIHMTLARIEGAPEGVKGISLFIVPKFLDSGVRNDVFASGLEHKMGIHASPTAVMNFGDNAGAVGYLVGEAGQGLKYMFTMMNNARLSVAVEGLGIAEKSYQMALLYAQNRVQGKIQYDNFSKYSAAINHGDTKAISHHPDVLKTLLKIKAHAEAARAIIYFTAKFIDLAHYTKNSEYQDVVDILIPVAKSYASEVGFWAASEAMQVYGGMGYIEETGIAQNLRDARIAMIYEGTNGIQAMDLVLRKLMLHDGRLFSSLLKNLPNAAAQNNKLYLNKLRSITENMQQLLKSNAGEAAFNASDFLLEFAKLLGVILLNDQVAVVKTGDVARAEFGRQKQLVAEFYAEHILKLA